MVDELMRRLEEASIGAFCATERTVGEIYLGGPPSVSVWIKDSEQGTRAGEILREVQAQRTTPRCPKCGYDLRGHSGDTTCPECGDRLTAKATDRQCPRCHEAVPRDFEICWNCGADLRARNERDA